MGCLILLTDLACEFEGSLVINLAVASSFELGFPPPAIGINAQL